MTELVLKPLSLLYGAGVSARNAAFDHGVLRTESVPCPVISVGNVTAGGSGKTPFASYVAREIVERARRPVILSRGYGGTVPGPLEVRPSSDVLEVGDEAAMHARRLFPAVKVVVSRERVPGARYVVDENLGDVIVLDDGLQHRYLERDVNLVLIDITSKDTIDAILENRLLPFGPVREPLVSALRRATGVVIVHRSAHAEMPEVPEELSAHFDDLPVFHFSIRPRALVDMVGGVEFSLEDFQERSSIGAMTAIAGHDQFFNMLGDCGIELARKKSFRDHHVYSAADWEEMRLAVSGPIIVTAKDAVKLESYVRVPDKVFVLEISGSFFTPEDEQRFWKFVSRATRIN